MIFKGMCNLTPKLCLQNQATIHMLIFSRDCHQIIRRLTFSHHKKQSEKSLMNTQMSDSNQKQAFIGNKVARSPFM